MSKSDLNFPRFEDQVLTLFLEQICQ